MLKLSFKKLAHLKYVLILLHDPTFEPFPKNESVDLYLLIDLVEQSQLLLK